MVSRCSNIVLGGGGGGNTWAAQKHSEAGYGRPVDRGVWTAKTVKRPRQQPAHPQYANYWAPLTRKRHSMPHPAQSQHTNYWAPRTRKRHQQEHRPQRPTESSDPTQHAKGRTGDRPGPRKGATTRRNVTQGAEWYCVTHGVSVATPSLLQTLKLSSDPRPLPNPRPPGAVQSGFTRTHWRCWSANGPLFLLLHVSEMIGARVAFPVHGRDTCLPT